MSHLHSMIDFGFSLSVANDENVDELCSLYIKVFSSTPGYESIVLADLKKEMLFHIKHGFISLVFADGAIIGFLCALPVPFAYELEPNFKKLKTLKQDNNFYFSSFAISSFFTKQGLGKYLFYPMKIQIPQNTSRLYVCCRCDALVVNSFFKKLNFKTIDKDKHTTNGVSSEKYIWELNYEKNL